jgi:hypothetical protein
MTRLLRIGVAALAVPATALVLLQAPAPAATPAPPSVVVKLSARAQLSADRRTANVKVAITCKSATPAPITATVAQNRSSLTVRGHGSSGASYKCNGRTQFGVVPVKASGRQRFQPGGASATADVTLMGSDGTP